MLHVGVFRNGLSVLCSLVVTCWERATSKSQLTITILLAEEKRK